LQNRSVSVKNGSYFFARRSLLANSRCSGNRQLDKMSYVKYSVYKNVVSNVLYDCVKCPFQTG